MKEWLKQLGTKIIGNGFLLLLIISVLYILYLRECKRPEPCPAEGEIIVPIAVWNKIQELANKPATTHIDTVWLEKPTTNPDPQPPLPDPKPTVDTTINSYSDTLHNKEIHVWVDYKIKGTLVDRSWYYKPIINTIHTVDSIPYPVYIKGDPYEVKIPQNGLYIYGLAGGNAGAFLFGGGLDFITKKNTEIGYLYQRYGTQNFHSVKLGIKIFNKNK